MTELALHVLLALGEGPAHGYAIGKDVEERSGGRLDPTTGALYQVLRRLTDQGFIQAVTPAGSDSGDTRRKYFALTRSGRAAAEAELERLARLVKSGSRRIHRVGSR